MIKILRYYRTPNNKSPFREWLDNIQDKNTYSRIERRLQRMESGNYGDYKSLGNSVYELKLNFGSGYRIYFAEIDEIVVILFCGGDKSTQAKDIIKARLFWKTFQEVI